MIQVWREIWPPAPTFTDEKLSDQSGRVFLVTGGASGLGFLLAKFLYQVNGTVYIAGRSHAAGTKAIEIIKSQCLDSKGRLEFLHLDLADLSATKKSANEFLARERRLDVLWHNAGVMFPPAGSKTKQGYELQLGTNCIAPFLLNHHLHPLLKHTAAISPANSVRVIWLSSLTHRSAPSGGIHFDDPNFGKNPSSTTLLYGQSKAGNVLLAAEFARKTQGESIVSVSLNPGNLKTPLQRHMPKILAILFRPMLHEPRYGAYSELFAGLSPDITLEHNGQYLIPWGRLGQPRDDIAKGFLSAQEGGTGTARRFWEWCEMECGDWMERGEDVEL